MPDAGKPWHGTMNGYKNRHCRCPDCRAAWAEWCRDAKTRRQANLATSGVTHGTTATYGNHGCRCQPCTDAHVAVRRLHRHMRSDG